MRVSRTKLRQHHARNTKMQYLNQHRYPYMLYKCDTDHPDNERLHNSTFYMTACGLCCAVMVADRLLIDPKFDLVDALQLSYDCGANHAPGTDYKLYAPALCEKLGLRYEGTNDMAVVKRCLETGGCVVANSAATGKAIPASSPTEATSSASSPSAKTESSASSIPPRSRTSSTNREEKARSKSTAISSTATERSWPRTARTGTPAFGASGGSKDPGGSDRTSMRSGIKRWSNCATT